MGLQIGLGVFEYDFPPGYKMGGYSGRKKPSIGTHDPITARAVLFENDSSKILLIEADFVGLIKQRVVKLKEEWSALFDIPVDNILVGIIHSHSSVLNIKLFAEPNPDVADLVDEGLRQAVNNAFSSKFNASLETIKGELSGVSFNRRDWDPLSEIVNTEIILVKILDEVGQLRGLLYNWSCHPVVMGDQNLELSADWPYFTQQYLRKTIGNDDLFVMFLQGTPGNLNPRNTTMNGPATPHTFDDCQEIGDEVGQHIQELLSNETLTVPLVIEDSDQNLLGICLSAQLPFEDPDKAEFFADFSEMIEVDGQPKVSTLVQGIRIGSLGIIGLPGEIFSEIGIVLKRSGLFDNLMVVGYTNDYIGYVGTPQTYAVGGYEMLMMSFSPDEGPILEENSIRILKSLLQE